MHSVRLTNVPVCRLEFRITDVGLWFKHGLCTRYVVSGLPPTSQQASHSQSTVGFSQQNQAPSCSQNTASSEPSCSYNIARSEPLFEEQIQSVIESKAPIIIRIPRGARRSLALTSEAVLQNVNNDPSVQDKWKPLFFRKIVFKRLQPQPQS
ncbi:hypothetical protein GJ496_002759 [Pomphorhynchus laevis]|nr:hypothetical protein GJ496_002759 [Pomphorhynchus laevis]